jgi:medium-chain acyl-[acyl-carrier-protein] hydrolase
VKSSATIQHPWILGTHSKAYARLRLFCFSHSGGGASFYRHWDDAIGDEIDVCPVQLPGRENRRSEAPFTRFDPLIETLADALSPYMDMPFALFGHSLGALLSFGLARHLRRQGRPDPLHLFVSGRRAPHLPREDGSVATLPDKEFIEKIRHFHGTDEEILRNAELMELFLPLLRADFSIYESFVYTAEPPFHCPISAFGGLDDNEVSVSSLIAWKEHTTNAFGLHQFPGGHFFLLDMEEQLLQIMKHEMAAFLEIV